MRRNLTNGDRDFYIIDIDSVENETLKKTIVADSTDYDASRTNVLAMIVSSNRMKDIFMCSSDAKGNHLSQFERFASHLHAESLKLKANKTTTSLPDGFVTDLITSPLFNEVSLSEANSEMYRSTLQIQANETTTTLQVEYYK
jgi:hypothetical protein